MVDNNNLERLLEYYRPRVRERADQLLEVGGRLSHHTVWFPLVDAYQPNEGEAEIGRELHKKAALQVFKEWCEEMGVKPASVAGEVGHNLLVLIRGLSFIGMGATGIGTGIVLFKGQMAAANLTLSAFVVLVVVFLGSSWIHRKYFERVFANTTNVDGGDAFEDKPF